MIVVARNLIHAALWLILTFFGMAVIFAILNAGFLAVAQVVIYIGAIAILMIFAVMLTRHVVGDMKGVFNKNVILGLLVAVIVFVGLVYMLSNWNGFNTLPEPLPPGTNTIVDLGTALVAPDQFVLAFEVASILLLAALIGALSIAWKQR
jgi:NADH-quinone oxidoreductase subunit J